MSLPTFGEVTDALFDLQREFDIEVTPHDGYLTINMYVGIANTDLFRQGQQMFAPAE